VTVYVDPTLGQPGLTNAQDLVNDADRVVTANDTIFGTTGGPVSVIVFALGGNTDGTGGADHMSCDFVNGGAIEVCTSFGDSARVSARRSSANVRWAEIYAVSVRARPCRAGALR